jgi:hypothetical protein
MLKLWSASWSQRRPPHERRQRGSSVPTNWPAKCTGRPSKCFLRLFSAGPCPTRTNRQTELCSSTAFRRYSFFSTPSLPTYKSRVESSWPAERLFLISRLRYRGANVCIRKADAVPLIHSVTLRYHCLTSVLMPFCHTSTLGTPNSCSSFCSCGDVHRVRSAKLCNVRTSQCANASITLGIQGR